MSKSKKLTAFVEAYEDAFQMLTEKYIADLIFKVDL